MNIFVLDKDPEIAAQYHNDRHVTKMILELTQQLASAVRRHGAKDDQMPLAESSGKPFIGGYKHHPCTIWCGDSRANFEWAAEHALCLCEEFSYRRNWNKKHVCEEKLGIIEDLAYLIPDLGPTPFAQAMPEQYKNPCAVTAYRDYYNAEKIFMNNGKRMDFWTVRPKPHWWTGIGD